MPRKKTPTKWEHIAVEPDTKSRFEKQAKKRSQFLYETAKDAVELLENQGKKTCAKTVLHSTGNNG